MSEHSAQAQHIILALVADMSGRSGFQQAIDQCDIEIQQEIFNTWCTIVDAQLAPLTKPKLIYKIRSENGLFSSGGSTPKFTTKGKVWTGKGGISNHLHILDSRGRSIYRTNNAKVIAYELSENVVGESMPVDEWMGALNDKKLKREQNLLKQLGKLLKKSKGKSCITN